jgi:hypothetical protein
VINKTSLTCKIKSDQRNSFSNVAFIDVNHTLSEPKVYFLPLQSIHFLFSSSSHPLSSSPLLILLSSPLLIPSPHPLSSSPLLIPLLLW